MAEAFGRLVEGFQGAQTSSRRKFPAVAQGLTKSIEGVKLSFPLKGLKKSRPPKW